MNANTMPRSVLPPFGQRKKSSRSSHGGSNSVVEIHAKRKKINSEVDSSEVQVWNAPAKGLMKGLLLGDASKDFPQSHSEVEEFMGHDVKFDGLMKGLLLGGASKDLPQSHSEVEEFMGHDVKFDVEQQRPDHECGFFVDDLIRELDYDLADRSGLQLMGMVDGDLDFDCGFYVEDFLRTLDAVQS